jgi:hypothetical protein
VWKLQLFCGVDGTKPNSTEEWNEQDPKKRKNKKILDWTRALAYTSNTMKDNINIKEIINKVQNNKVETIDFMW